jgi:hypothetical protein
MENDFVQSRVVLAEDRRDSFDRGTRAGPQIEQAHPAAGALADEGVALGEEGETGGDRESGGDHFDPDPSIYRIDRPEDGTDGGLVLGSERSDRHDRHQNRPDRLLHKD